MGNDKLNGLLRDDNKKEVSQQQTTKFVGTKKRIRSICKSLSVNTKDYKPEITVDIITNYIESEDRLERILYSEISNYIYSLETTKRGIFSTNVEKMLLYSLDEKIDLGVDQKKMIVKIYDHFQLAQHQIENAENISKKSIAEAIEGTKEKLQDQIKSVEREYISILGIFASIVLAFVGGATFSSSVLQNISSVSIFRLLLIVDFLASVLLNVIYILVKFIFVINNKDTSFFKIKELNIAFLIIAVIIVISWIINFDRIPNSVSEFLPWSK